MYYANRRQQFLVEQGYNYHVLRDKSVQKMSSSSFVFASEDAQLQLLKHVLESVKRGEGAEAEEDEVALHDASATAVAPKGGAPQTMDAPGGDVAVAAVAPVSEQRFSLASLSGGLDGTYAVTAALSAKTQRVKPPV